MASVRKNALTQTKIVLDAASSIVTVSEDPYSIEEGQLPAVWIDMEPDDERDSLGTMTGTSALVYATLSIFIFNNPVSTGSVSGAMEDLYEELLADLFGATDDYLAMTPSVAITKIWISGSTKIDVERGLSEGKISISYSGTG